MDIDIRIVASQLQTILVSCHDIKKKFVTSPATNSIEVCLCYSDTLQQLSTDDFLQALLEYHSPHSFISPHNYDKSTGKLEVSLLLCWLCEIYQWLFGYFRYQELPLFENVTNNPRLTPPATTHKKVNGFSQI
jgi:hypothetical protein